ncbi:MAG: cell envelope biogenesis protein OmpA [Syntrophales bacterium]|nr:cell envelope biogenesis protein OmpA [Syntrophales bacterium]
MKKKKKYIKYLFLASTVTLLLVSCATQGPILYPNEHLKRVGTEQAQKDVEECEALADAYLKSHRVEDAAKSTVIGGGSGAVVGGAVGAVTGNIGRGISIGGAAGAASGLVRGVIKATQPSPIFKRFVERCLRERGYEPIGWE